MGGGMRANTETSCSSARAGASTTMSILKFHYSDCFIHPSLLPCATAVYEQNCAGNDDELIFYQVEVSYEAYIFMNNMSVKCVNSFFMFKHQQCHAYLNSLPFPTTNALRYTISRNYFDAAVEICILSLIENPTTG